ncbi:general secretion pathway protein B [Noviherbaspirillum humi]|uniref:General secretion pathway protein B n=1 Tax=Noviherbaspirillum humi TaxID=1688639 RepID=A0A239KFK1_9BURK|nr:general secretion pathway protein GspB [Noviherbaspirillum humi]SNT16429.1 general secretion pathway protein B [Noviherbaspirillum humi]
MSFILDALKKAESERDAGKVPDLQAQPQIASGRRPAPASAGRRARLFILGAAGAAMLAAGIWLNQGARTPAPVSAPSAAPAAPSAPAIAAPPPATTPPPPVAQAAPQPPAAPESAPADRNAAASQPGPDAAARREAARNRQKEREKEKEKEAQARAKAQAKKEAALAARPAEPAPPPAGTFQQLPEQVQREIPAFSVNGFLYSPNKADRSVLINQKLMHEGEEVAPGLRLESITSSGMILNYRGHRYRASY